MKKSKKPDKIVFLDLDDFGESNNRLDWLWMLKKEFPNFKVNLFTIPDQVYGNFCAYIRSLNWVQTCIHGFHHEHDEEISEKILDWRSEELVLFAKVYRAPYWQLSDKMYERLRKLDYKIMLHPDDPREGIKFNWNIKDSPPPLDILYAHGHIQDVCENGLVESFGNLLKLPNDTEFRFL
jgi:hypothetical protein